MKGWRVVRLFVLLIFVDYYVEREVLVKKVCLILIRILCYSFKKWLLCMNKLGYRKCFKNSYLVVGILRGFVNNN